jgi:hypothetical protein
MKFTYDTNPDERECVAYIDDEGDLIIKERDGKTVYCLDGAFDPSCDNHRFYPGDSITITFE